MTIQAIVILCALIIIGVCFYLNHIKKKKEFDIDKFLAFALSAPLIPFGLAFLFFIFSGEESIQIRELSIQLFYSAIAFVGIGISRIVAYLKAK